VYPQYTHQSPVPGPHTSIADGTRTPIYTIENGPRIPIYSEDFAADPHKAYRQMRDAYGALVPVEIWPGVPATLVINYDIAKTILSDGDRFPADPSIWQKGIPDCPIKPMVEYRPNAIRTSGEQHGRLRRSVVNALEQGIDLNTVRPIVERSALPLINTFCTDGRADVLNQYILPLVFSVLCQELGCPEDIGQRVAQASAQMFDGVDTAQVNMDFGQALLELTLLKRAHPGNDVTTKLIDDPAGLTDEEVMSQLILLFAAGVEPPVNLIANTLVLMLTDERYTGHSSDGHLTTKTALEERLATDPPMANYCITYPRQPISVEGQFLPANEPVIISMAACNTDPQKNSGEFIDNGWNLAWSTGPHACPAHARPFSLLLAQEIIDQLLDALPDMELEVPQERLLWRPGPFHRALTTLPVVFPKTAPLSI